MQTIQVQCTSCNTDHEIQVNPIDIAAWQRGALIQRALPYLTAGERELLISGTCTTCFEEIFSGDE